AEQGRHGPVVAEAEAPDLIAEKRIGGGHQDRAAGAEHADLLVHVPQVRDLEQLGLSVEARAAVGPEEAGELALTRVGARIEPVARLAGPVEVARDADEEVAPRLLRGRE